MKLKTENMIKAIEKRSAKSSNLICQRMDTVQRKSATRQQTINVNAYPYCENPAFSLAVGGKMYKAVQPPARTETIPDEVRADLLDTLACFYRLDAESRPSGKKMKEAFDRACEKQDEHRQIDFRADL